MDRLQIHLPEALMAFVQDRISTDGYSDATEYVCALIRADRKERAMRQLEVELARGFSGPSEPVTPEMWESLRRSIGLSEEQ